MRIADEPTPAELAVLGVLGEGSRHGYGINAIIEERGMRHWTEIGFSSVYAILQRLEGAGLVKGHSEAVGRAPARKVFSVTRKGRSVLKRATKHFLTDPERPPFRVCLGIANLNLLTSNEAIEALEAYRKSIKRNVVEIEEAMDRQSPIPFTAEAIFEHALLHANAEIAWAEEILSNLRAREEEDMEWVKDT